MIYSGDRLCTCKIDSLKSISKFDKPFAPPVPPFVAVADGVGEFIDV